MDTALLRKVRTGMFTDPRTAEAAYHAAIRRGYKPEEINIIMSEETRRRLAESDLAGLDVSSKTVEGLGIGGAIGATVVGVISAIAALSSAIVIPGLGLVVAGPLAAGLIGAGAGGIGGGILGALVGAGISDDRATMYESGLRNGGILMGVNSRDENDAQLMEDWRSYNGRDIY